MRPCAHYGAMEHTRGATGGLTQHWVSLSERFLAAAELLDAAQEVTLPRLHLAGVALEYRLKAYFCAHRGGTPDTADLTRLAALAGRCGLSLGADQLDLIEHVNRARFGSGSLPSRGGDPARLPVPMARVRALCEHISGQL